jgi:hypothetical protein
MLLSAKGLQLDSPAPPTAGPRCAGRESPTADASDRDVVACAREGDQYAYREMLRRYGPPVFDLIYGMVGQRELAEDLAQETFVKAFRALDRHDPERKPAAWILRIANNTAIDYVRRKRPDSTRPHLTKTPGYIDRRAVQWSVWESCVGSPALGHNPEAPPCSA